MWWKEAIKKRVVRLCDAGLVGGPPHAEYLAALGMSKTRIYLGYDVVDNRHFEVGANAARLDALRTRRLLGLPDDYFLAIGRFVEKKNHAWLLKTYAAYRVQAGVNAWKLVVLGDGLLMEKLVKTRNELGLDNWVILPGAKRYEELPAYYALAGAFVHASEIEQWGLVVNEAMAAGLPVLVSDKCGCADSLVNRGINGFLFDPRNDDELASLMLRISCSEPEGRAAMGLASRKIISRWSPRIFAESLYKAAQAAQAQRLARVIWSDRVLLWALIHR
jgi:glycosyltransferase involved in cell wall biosynthesis